jgi:hypothetical protein
MKDLKSSKNLENRSKQKKFKRKYHIFAKELDGISWRNWKSEILLDIQNAIGLSQTDELISFNIEGKLL